MGKPKALHAHTASYVVSNKQSVHEHRFSSSGRLPENQLLDACVCLLDVGQLSANIQIESCAEAQIRSGEYRQPEDLPPWQKRFFCSSSYDSVEESATRRATISNLRRRKSSSCVRTLGDSGKIQRARFPRSGGVSAFLSATRPGSTWYRSVCWHTKQSDRAIKRVLQSKSNPGCWRKPVNCLDHALQSPQRSQGSHMPVITTL